MSGVGAGADAVLRDVGGGGRAGGAVGEGTGADAVLRSVGGGSREKNIRNMQSLSPALLSSPRHPPLALQKVVQKRSGHAGFLRYDEYHSRARQDRNPTPFDTL